LRHLFGRVCVLFALVGGLLGCEDHYLLGEQRLPDVEDGGADADLTEPDLSVQEDRDRDGVPDRADYWPDDPQWPGRALEGYLYMHSLEVLYRAPLRAPGEVTRVDRLMVLDVDGAFVPLYDNILDAALDPYGVLYVVSERPELLACQPDTAFCQPVHTQTGCAPSEGSLLANALTWVSTPDHPEGALLSMGADQGCYLLPVVEGGDLTGYRGSARVALPGGYSVSGDVTQMADGLLVVSAIRPNGEEALMVGMPTLGQVLLGDEALLGAASLGEANLWGLVALRSGLVGFDDSGGWWRLEGVGDGADALRVESMGRVLLNDLFAGAAAPPLFFESPP
jgi:hypothetical protein